MKRYCFKCNKEIKPLYTEEHNDKPESEMWNNGIVDKISAGYGSKHDGSMYIITICDDCIESQKDKLEYVGNYMGMDKNYADELSKISIK